MVGSQTTDRFNGVVASLAIKVPCKAVAVSNIALAAAQTVNGVAVTTGDRVLCVGQTDAIENGIWIVDSSSAWSRSPDMDGNRDITTDSIVVCNRSGDQAPVIYHMTSAMPLIVGEDANNWDVLPAGTEANDLTAAVTWDNIPDANVPESAVTQHEAALTILAANISAEASVDGWVLTSDGAGNAVWEAQAGAEVNDLTAAVVWPSGSGDGSPDHGSGTRVRADINAADPPVAGIYYGSFDLFDLADAVMLGQVGYTNGSENFFIKNHIRGGNFEVSVTMDGGAVRTLLDLSASAGSVYRSVGNMAWFVDNVDRCMLATGGADISFYHNDVEVLRTDAIADGGAQLKNSLTGTGNWERILCASDLGAVGGEAQTITVTWTTGNTGVHNHQSGSQTTYQSGASLRLPTATTAELADITDTINTADSKQQAVVVFDTTANIPMYATGSADASTWVGEKAGSTITITPTS